MMPSSRRFGIPLTVALCAAAVYLLPNAKASSVASNETTIHGSNAASSLRSRLEQGPDGLNFLDLFVAGVVVLLGFELLDFISGHTGEWIGAKQIPVRGKHLDDLSMKDRLFIAISKLMTPVYVYFNLRYAYFEPNIPWDLNSMTLFNTVLPLIPLFLTFDFFYTLLHGFLHIKAVYSWVHKHHHHQKAPSRANVDAVNVHPLEFFLGEYNHLWSLFLLCRYANLQVHVVGCMLFLVVGGILAGINHTRHDVVISIFGLSLFDSKAHDVHHRIPQCNYGQYSMFWDSVFGFYRPYDPDDRVNPDAQLDPVTRKSLSYGGATVNSTDDDKKGR